MIAIKVSDLAWDGQVWVDAGLSRPHLGLGIAPSVSVCCAEARRGRCVCELAVTCPTHGAVHYGTHS